MKRAAILIGFILLCMNPTFCQQQDSLQQSEIPHDSLQFRCGPPLIPGLIMYGGIISGMSYYAAKPRAYGDKVIGGMYAGVSLISLVMIPFNWFDKDLKADPQHKTQRIFDSIILLGLSYGSARIARYNLLQAQDDPFNTRFTRNLLEINATYIIPIAITLGAQAILDKRKRKRSLIY